MIKKIVYWFFATTFAFGTLGGLAILVDLPVQPESQFAHLSMVLFTLLFLIVSIFFVKCALSHSFSAGTNQQSQIDAINSLDCLTEQKKMFLVNYLGDRSVTWHIDEPVKETYPDIEQNIEDLQKIGLIKKENSVYVLTDTGLEMRKAFRAQEKARRKKMHQEVVAFALSSDYLLAYNARVKYERESVIPHGISVSLSGESNTPSREEVITISHSVKKYVENSYRLDFSDCQNSERFKEAMRKFYVGMEVTGASDLDIPDDFEERLEEKLDCPTLDIQLAEKCQFQNPPKLKIYFRTKVRVFNHISTKLIDHWDGKFDLGIYDCTDPFHASMAQYEQIKNAGIDRFPKTFQTFEKHKKANSEKYKYWVAQYEAMNK